MFVVTNRITVKKGFAEKWRQDSLKVEKLKDCKVFIKLKFESDTRS